MERDKKRVAEIAGEVGSNTWFIEYSQKYAPNSVEAFIQRYAEQKVDMETRGDIYLKRDERDMENLIIEANRGLYAIQYKKLFDLECLWRAEKIKLPGIQLTWDFKNISENILAGDIPDPITEDDVRLYQEFLKTQEACFYEWGCDYPDYESVKDDLDSDELELPEYFEFHNLRTGHQVYLQLPDIRGEKEDFYHSLYFERQRKLNPPKPYKEHKPFLSSWYDTLIEVAEKIGDRKFARYLKSVVDRMDKDPNYMVDWAYTYLCEVKDNHLIRLNPNIAWMDALYEAAKMHQNQIVSDMLPRVWEEYKMKREMKIGYEKGKSIWDVERWKEIILGGRELNGEPRDFDF